MASELRTYRHSVTGLIQVLSPRVGEYVAELEEVPDDAKPLAYTPIPAEAIQELLDQDEADEDEQEN